MKKIWGILGLLLLGLSGLAQAEGELYEAYYAFQEGKYESVIDQTNQIIQVDNLNYNALKLRAKALYELRRYDEALEDFNYAFELNNQEAEINFYIGFINYQKGDYTKAINYLSQAISIDPRAHLYALRAQNYLDLGRSTEAAEDIDQAIYLNPSEPTFYRIQADIETVQNRCPQAIEHYSIALNIGGEDPLIYHSRAKCYRLSKDYQGAINDLNRARELYIEQMQNSKST